MTRRARLFGLAMALCGPVVSGCQRLNASVPGLNPTAARGIELTSHYGCASCHDIPGAAITGHVGPTLRGVHQRAFLVGGLPNTPGQLVDLIRFPERARPGTLMPNLGVSEPDARELAAFLYTLR
jgi:cytochrome c